MGSRGLRGKTTGGKKMKWLSLSFTALLLGLALYGVVPAAENTPRDAAKAIFEVQ